MEYLPVLIQLLMLITAIVALKKSVVDKASAQMKLETEKLTSAQPHQTTHLSHWSSPLSLRIFAAFMLVASTGTLVWLAFGPLSGDAPTLKDLALISLCIISSVQAYRWM